ncbi:MAG: 4Fe-4S ferredoxin [Bacteroidetes bacterium GWE2_39_28]|nr:MAG: 4Fe-4S ferredoxin [Bacteroidetes bacterium GWE2_39_28]OFY12612.1 MAG: 4Fe-4S ferredoxin [Bacteroidetes bacterium GWF2_39_10]OFZ11611.1 MAG: 4Fe-4S ferredoxin [Bacteroidetes bacterium RIFOXYC2_FULL_39_11]HCT94674.1 4Fe-4S ferredoxin [Rikenellaceae bacterium]
MKRTVIKIDEDLCNGCGNCVEGCHEGALQLINGKAVMISDLYCDGLGACIGDCPVGAIELIEKETEPYDEVKVMERISPKGERVVLAHLKHLRDHNEMEWFNQGVEWCKKNGFEIDLSKITPVSESGISNRENASASDHSQGQGQGHAHGHAHSHSQSSDGAKPEGCGCPGAAERDFRNVKASASVPTGNFSGVSELQQWPVQLHLLNPAAGFLRNSDLLLASDCSAFSHGNFHGTFLKNKSLAIACPKLDSNTQSYVDKLTIMIDESKINTLTILKMEVPCCGGLLQMAKHARERASRNIPIKSLTMSLQGEILSEEWV